MSSKLALTGRLAPLLLAFAASIGLACGPGGASPIPQPPIMAVPIDAVTTVPPKVGPGGRPELPAISVQAGALPINAQLSVTNLDNTEPPTIASAEADGSFVLPLDFNPGDELRLEVLRGDERSLPTDLFVNDLFELAAPLRLDCVEVDPQLSAQLSSDQPAGSLAISNHCAVDLLLDNGRLRSGLPDFSLQTSLPLTVPAGETGTLEVSLSPQSTAPVADVLFVDVTADGDAVRYPITLWSRP